jgi:hypothetical protein
MKGSCTVCESNSLDYFIEAFNDGDARILTWKQQDAVRDFLIQLKQIQDNTKCPQIGKSP